MLCRYCQRPLRLFDPRRPLRALAPRCRVCRQLNLGWPHKLALFLLGALAFYLLIQRAFG